MVWCLEALRSCFVWWRIWSPYLHLQPSSYFTLQSYIKTIANRAPKGKNHLPQIVYFLDHTPNLLSNSKPTESKIKFEPIFIPLLFSRMYKRLRILIAAVIIFFFLSNHTQNFHQAFN